MKSTQLFKTVTVSLWIPGRVTPKARPRVTQYGTFFPKTYQNWQSLASLELTLQMMELPHNFPIIENASLSCTFKGKHQGDLSNLIGSVEDALVKVGMLKDDRSSILTSISARIEPTGKPQGVEIVLQGGVKIEI